MARSRQSRESLRSLLIFGTQFAVLPEDHHSGLPIFEPPSEKLAIRYAQAPPYTQLSSDRVCYRSLTTVPSSPPNIPPNNAKVRTIRVIWYFLEPDPRHVPPEPLMKIRLHAAFEYMRVGAGDKGAALVAG